MCGIFGVICAPDRAIDLALVRALPLALLRYSETRGREAAGLAAHAGGSIDVLKQGGSVASFMATPMCKFWRWRRWSPPLHTT